VNNVWGGLVAGSVPPEPEFEVAPWYSRIAKRDAELRLEVMIVDTPAAVAISAAMSFVSIPPVPKLEPRVAVLTTGNHINKERVLTTQSVTLSTDRNSRLHHFDEPRGWIFPRICGVKSIHVGEKEEVIRMDHGRGNRRKCVVIAKFYFLV
jgi:hypothetical protein